MSPHENDKIDDVCQRMYAEEQAQMREDAARKKLEEARERLNKKRKGRLPEPPQPAQPGTPPETPTATTPQILRPYDLVPSLKDSLSYAQALDIIRKTATGHEIINGVYRPLTFKENIQIRTEVGEKILADNTTKNQKKLEALLKAADVYITFLDSITSIAYPERDNTRFKINTLSHELLTLPADYDKAFLPCTYTTTPGTELLTTKAIYNTPLTEQQFLNHQGWNAILEGDTTLQERYAKIIYTILENACAFHLLQNPEEDQVRALFAGILYNGSIANGSLSLYSNARFLRVGPNGTAARRRTKKIKHKRT